MLFKDSGYDEAYSLGKPDIAKVAEGLGADVVDVNKPADLQKVWPNVVGRANSGRPQVIVAHVDPKAAPPYWSPPYWQKTVD